MPDYRYKTLADGRTIDLLAPVTLNQNPYDIEPINGHPSSYVAFKYNWFNAWMFPAAFKEKEADLLVDDITTSTFQNPDKINPTDTSVNSEEYVNKTEDLIKKFNENLWYPYGDKYPTNRHIGRYFPLTTEDIKAVQKFNQKTDPNVLVDGWLGTQTFQLSYPLSSTLLASYWNKGGGAKSEINPDPNTWVPSVWGDYTFVIRNEYILKFRDNKLNGTPLSYYFIPYDPKKYKFLYNQYLYYQENQPHQEGNVWTKTENGVTNYYMFQNGEVTQVYPLSFEPTGYPPLELRVFRNGQYYQPANWNDLRISKVYTSEIYGKLYYVQHSEWKSFLERRVFPNNGTPPGQRIALIAVPSIKADLDIAKNQLKQKAVETEDKVRNAIANVKNTVSNTRNSL